MSKYSSAPEHVSLGTSTRQGRHVERWLEKRFGDNEHFWIWKPGRCWNCKWPCFWSEINFQTYIHPGKCSKAKWLEYDEAERDSRLKKIAFDLYGVVASYVGRDVKMPFDKVGTLLGDPQCVGDLLDESYQALKFYGYEPPKPGGFF